MIFSCITLRNSDAMRIKPWGESLQFRPIGQPGVHIQRRREETSLVPSDVFAVCVSYFNVVIIIAVFTAPGSQREVTVLNRRAENVSWFNPWRLCVLKVTT